MHFPRAYRSLPRPSSLTKPSHSPTGVFALYQVHHFSSFLLQPRKLYANISVKPHNFHSVSYYADIVVCFPVILYTTVIANSRPLRPSSLIFMRNCIIIAQSHEHALYQSFTQSHPASFKGGDPAAGSPTATLLRLLPRC